MSSYPPLCRLLCAFHLRSTTHALQPQQKANGCSAVLNGVFNDYETIVDKVIDPSSLYLIVCCLSQLRRLLGRYMLLRRRELLKSKLLRNSPGC